MNVDELDGRGVIAQSGDEEQRRLEKNSPFVAANDPEKNQPQQEMKEGAKEDVVMIMAAGRYKAILVAAAGDGVAPGLLGEYLRGSPQLSDLLAVWDLDVRKVCILMCIVT